MSGKAIVILGSGNVATCFGKALQKAGHQIVAVYSPNEKNAAQLSAVLNTLHAKKISELPSDADFYLLAVSDAAIAEVAKNLQDVQGTVVHTAGSVTVEVLKKFPSYGVLYPLISINKSLEQDLHNAPICIETNNRESRDKLHVLASSISKFIHYVDSEQRLRLHLAAVLANNHIHHLYYLSQTILKRSGLEFNLLETLIKDSTAKVLEQSNKPLNIIQTGPAQRGDLATIRKHDEVLKRDFPDILKVYDMLNESIIRHK